MWSLLCSAGCILTAAGGGGTVGLFSSEDLHEAGVAEILVPPKKGVPCLVRSGSGTVGLYFILNFDRTPK